MFHVQLQTMVQNVASNVVHNAAKTFCHAGRDLQKLTAIVADAIRPRLARAYQLLDMKEAGCGCSQVDVAQYCRHEQEVNALLNDHFQDIEERIPQWLAMQFDLPERHSPEISTPGLAQSGHFQQSRPDQNKLRQEVAECSKQSIRSSQPDIHSRQIRQSGATPSSVTSLLTAEGFTCYEVTGEGNQCGSRAIMLGLLNHYCSLDAASRTTFRMACDWKESLESSTRYMDVDTVGIALAALGVNGVATQQNGRYWVPGPAMFVNDGDHWENDVREHAIGDRHAVVVRPDNRNHFTIYLRDTLRVAMTQQMGMMSGLVDKHAVSEPGTVVTWASHAEMPLGRFLNRLASQTVGVVAKGSRAIKRAMASL